MLPLIILLGISVLITTIILLENLQFSFSPLLLQFQSYISCYSTFGCGINNIKDLVLYSQPENTFLPDIFYVTLPPSKSADYQSLISALRVLLLFICCLIYGVLIHESQETNAYLNPISKLISNATKLPQYLACSTMSDCGPHKCDLPDCLPANEDDNVEDYYTQPPFLKSESLNSDITLTSDQPNESILNLFKPKGETESAISPDLDFMVYPILSAVHQRSAVPEFPKSFAQTGIQRADNQIKEDLQIFYFQSTFAM